VEVRSTYS